MTNETRSPEEIEREIERERAGLSHTLDDLQDRFSIEGIARQFSDQFREHGGDIGRSVSEAVRRNPMALALTGVGLTWLMMGDRSNGRERHYRDDDHYDCNHSARSVTPYASRNAPGGYTARTADASSSSYTSASAREDIPSWARSDTDNEDRRGTMAKLGDVTSTAGQHISDAASSAGQRVSDTTSSAADAARNAGSAVSDKVKGAAGSVSEAGRATAESARNLAASAQERAAAMRARLAEGTEQLSEEARDRVIAARQRAVEARQAAMAYTRQGREKAMDMFEEQPLVGGALALAVGAAIGAALPRSQMEDRYLGEQSDQLMNEAERIYAEEKAKLTKVAQAATDEAKKIAQEMKQDADAAAPAETAAQALMDQAKASGKRVADAAEKEARKQNVGDVSQT